MPHCSPRGVPSRVVVIRVSVDGETWAELPARDARIPQLPVRQLYYDNNYNQYFIDNEEVSTNPCVIRINTGLT